MNEIEQMIRKLREGTMGLPSGLELEAAELLERLTAEQQKQEPDGEVVVAIGSLNDLVVIKWISDYHPKVGDKIYAAPPQDAQERKQLMAKMVDAFLSWPLPSTFAPDCGISFDGSWVDARGGLVSWPIGTNLFTAHEAQLMVEHMFAVADAATNEQASQDALPNRPWQEITDDVVESEKRLAPPSRRISMNADHKAALEWAPKIVTSLPQNEIHANLAAAYLELTAQLEAKDKELQDVLVASANVLKAERRAREEVAEERDEWEKQFLKQAHRAETAEATLRKAFEKPVAWRYRMPPNGDWHHQGHMLQDSNGMYETQPLFTKPDTKAVPAAAPDKKDCTTTRFFGSVIDTLSLEPVAHPDWRTMTVSELAAGNASLKAYSDELESLRGDAACYRHIRPHLHINSQGDLGLEWNALYIGPRDGIAKVTTRMDAAILAAIGGAIRAEIAKRAK